VYLDTNVVVYAVSRDPAYGSACKKWLTKIEKKEIIAESSPLTLVECLHAFKNINRIMAKKKRALIDVPGSISALLTLPLRWLDLTPAVILRASESAAPVTAGDAVHLATMEVHGVHEILSADAGFDSVPGIRRRDPLSM